MLALLTAVLGLLGGLVVGLLTQRWTERREHRAWLRDSRKTAYAEFVDKYQRLSRAIYDYQWEDGAPLPEDLGLPLYHLWTTIRVVGSEPACKLALDALNEVNKYAESPGGVTDDAAIEALIKRVRHELVRGRLDD